MQFKVDKTMRTLAITLLAVLAGAAPAAAEPTLRVDVTGPGQPTSSWVTGVDHAFSTPKGIPPANWLASADAPNPAVVSLTRVAGVGLVRFPGGTIANRYDFKAGLDPFRAPCQNSGVRGSSQPLSNAYGFDEHLAFVEAAGAEAQIMVPFAFETAQDAADWVEYANAPADGSNPGGGVDWAALRAANGHHAPYGIRRWEIGNEPDRPRQRYWLSADTDIARRQYARGGVHRVEDETADSACTWAAPSTGVANQVFRTRYAPVRGAGFKLAIGETVWRRVPNFLSVDDRPVYTLDERTGEIRFGDGQHGRVPPTGARVYVTYRTARLPGYDAFRRAMKRIDPSIDVCATWADARFLRQVRRLDCLAVHPYTLLGRYGAVLYNAAHYDAAIKGADATAARVRKLARALRRAPGDPFLAATEYGALGGSARLEPGSAGSMIHAVYMSTQQIAWVRQGLAWALGGRLTDFVFELVRGAGDRLTPAGELHRVFSRVAGGARLPATVRDNPVTHGYPAVRALATRGADGTLSLLLLNRSRDTAVDLRLELEGFTRSGAVAIEQATAASFDSPDASYEERREELGDALHLPPHSLTRVSLNP